MRRTDHAHMNFDPLIRTGLDAQEGSQTQRQALILERLNTAGFQSIAELSAIFNVSPQTIRRDVNDLAWRGKCRRSHGGIWPLQAISNADYSERRQMGYAVKQSIAALVAEQIPDGSSLFLGIGTTLELCAVALAQKKNLRVMTNNLHAVVALAGNPSTEIFIPSGRVRNLDLDVVSAEAHGFFDRYEVDIGIFSVGAISPEGALLDFHEDEVHMRQVLARNCRRQFLAFDSSKFARRATVRHGQITDVHAIFTDLLPPSPLLEKVNAAGVQLFTPCTPSSNERL